MSDGKPHWRDPRPEDYAWRPKLPTKRERADDAVPKTESKDPPLSPLQVSKSVADAVLESELEKLREAERATAVKMREMEISASRPLRWILILLIAALAGPVVGYYIGLQKAEIYRNMALGSSEDLRKQVVQLTDEASEMRKEMESLRARNSELKNQNNELGMQNQRLTLANEDLAAKLIAVNKKAAQNEAAANEADQLKNERDKARSASVAMQSTLDDVMEKLRDNDVSGALKAINKLKSK